MLIISIITVHLVSWVGSVLHSVPHGGGSDYAVFTFRVDQNKSMTTNILMNVLVPNVCLIIICMVCYKCELACDYNKLICYIFFYYIYRIILICLILKRKELLCVKYELFNLVISVVLAYLLIKYFLIHPDQIFIPLSELVNEFWLAIIVIIYNFFRLIVGKLFTQHNVVNEEMLDKYIKSRFNYLYSKYKDFISITKDDNNLWILIFSIMLFENFNRGGLIRKIERIKVRLGMSATVGIMQIKTDKCISDEESILLAYYKLKNEIIGGKLVVCT